MGRSRWLNLDSDLIWGLDTFEKGWNPIKDSFRIGFITNLNQILLIIQSFFIVPYSIDILIRIESDDFDSEEEEDGLENCYIDRDWVKKRDLLLKISDMFYVHILNVLSTSKFEISTYFVCNLSGINSLNLKFYGRRSILVVYGLKFD